jgi:putative nucleotidyltransferase with HDIG domain
MLPRKVADVATAVKMIGLAGVRNLVLSYGVTQVFSKMYKKAHIDKVMDHSYKVALYCSQIAKLKKMDALLEDIYVAALLHDFGKIITNSLQPALIEKLNVLCQEKDIPITSLEDLTKGYNHAIIGSLLAEKWMFPEKFVQCIKYHHMPLEGDEAYKGIMYTCYLGNEVSHMLEGKRSFNDFNYQVLKFFGIENEQRFDSFLVRIKNALHIE